MVLKGLSQNFPASCRHWQD